VAQAHFGKGRRLLQTLGEDKSGAKWDIETIRKSGEAFFVESIPNDDPLRPLAEKAIREGVFGVSLKDLTDDEIRGICDTRAAIVTSDTKNKMTPRVSQCPRKSLGAASEKLTRSRDLIFRNYLEALNTRLINEHILRRPFDIYVFSHTHIAEASYSPFAGTGSSWVPIVMNSRAWQRTISDEQLRSYMQQRNLKAADVLKLKPEDLPPCYPVVLIPAYTERPRGCYGTGNNPASHGHLIISAIRWGSCNEVRIQTRLYPGAHRLIGHSAGHYEWTRPGQVRNASVELKSRGILDVAFKQRPMRMGGLTSQFQSDTTI
jgi:hypothetical protein